MPRALRHLRGHSNENGSAVSGLVPEQAALPQRLRDQGYGGCTEGPAPAARPKACDDTRCLTGSDAAPKQEPALVEPRAGCVGVVVLGHVRLAAEDHVRQRRPGQPLCHVDRRDQLGHPESGPARVPRHKGQQRRI